MMSNFQPQKAGRSSRTRNSPLGLPGNIIYLIQWISLTPLDLIIHIAQVTGQFNQSLDLWKSLPLFCFFLKPGNFLSFWEMDQRDIPKWYVCVCLYF